MPFKGFRFSSRQRRNNEDELNDMRVSNPRVAYGIKPEKKKHHADNEFGWQGHRHEAYIEDGSSVALSEVGRIASSYKRSRQLDSSFVPKTYFDPNIYRERGGHRQGRTHTFERPSHQEYDGLYLYNNPLNHFQTHYEKKSLKKRNRRIESPRHVDRESYVPRRTSNRAWYPKVDQRQIIQSELEQEIRNLSISQLVDQLEAVRNVQELPRVVLTDGKDEDLYSVVSIITTPREIGGEIYGNMGRHKERKIIPEEREDVQNFIIPQVRRKYPPIRKHSYFPERSQCQEPTQERRQRESTYDKKLLKTRLDSKERESRPINYRMGETRKDRRTRPSSEQIGRYKEQEQSPFRAQGLAVNLDVDDCEMNGFYTGTLDENGQPSGMGVIKFENNDMYIGDFWRGKMHGRGTFMFDGFLGEHGAVLKGNFVNNRFSL